MPKSMLSFISRANSPILIQFSAKDLWLTAEGLNKYYNSDILGCAPCAVIYFILHSTYERPSNKKFNVHNIYALQEVSNKTKIKIEKKKNCNNITTSCSNLLEMPSIKSLEYCTLRAIYAL